MINGVKIKQKLGFLLLLAALGSRGAFSAPTHTNQDQSPPVPKRFIPIERAFKKFELQPFYQLKAHALYQEQDNQISGNILFYVRRQPIQAVGKGKLQAQFQGSVFSFMGQEGYFRNLLFFVVQKSSLGKPNFVNHWFVLNFNQLIAGIQRGKHRLNLSTLESEGKTAAGTLPLVPVLRKILVKSEGNGVANGALCRHYVVTIPLGDLFKILFPSLPSNSGSPPPSQAPPTSQTPQTSQTPIPMPFNFSKGFSTLPPVHANLWIGRKDGLLYRVYVPLQGKGRGGLNLNLTYLQEPPLKHFKIPAVAADARVLGFVPAQSLLHFTSGFVTSAHLQQSKQWRQKGLKEKNPMIARRDFFRAIHLDPEDAENYYLAAKEDYRLKQYGMCAMRMNKAILLDSTSDKFYALQGEAYQKLKFLALASWEYQASLYLNPAQKRIYLKLAQIYRQQKKFLEAKKMAEKAANLP